MKKTISISAFIIYHLSFIIFVSAQNLVPNPSFEEYDQCPDNSNIFDGYVKYWSNVNTLTPDYFNSCADEIPFIPGSTPWNAVGFQYPRTGQAYAGLAVFSDMYLTRDYIINQLVIPLESEKSYNISFYCSLNNRYSDTPFAYTGSMYAIDCLGAYLSDTMIHVNSDSVLSYNPQVSNATGVFLSDTLNWMLISGNYKAHGGEQYILIGNFSSDSMSNYIQVSDSWSHGAYYYIDDVSVTLVEDSIPSENSLIISNAFTPNGDDVNDAFMAHGKNIKEFHGKIFNRWGMELYEWDNVNSGWDGKYDGTYVSAGAYFYIINVNYYDGSNEEKKGCVMLIR